MWTVRDWERFWTGAGYRWRPVPLDPSQRGRGGARRGLRLVTGLPWTAHKTRGTKRRGRR